MAKLNRDDNRNLSPNVSFGNLLPTFPVDVAQSAIRLDSGRPRMSIKVNNISKNTESIFVSFSSDVTIDNGDEIQAGTSSVYDVAETGTNAQSGPVLRDLYAICETGTQDIRITEI